MPKFFEDISLQGSELRDSVLQNNRGDLNTFRLLGRWYWDSQDDGPWVAESLYGAVRVGRIRYWSEPFTDAGVAQPKTYATVATLWDLNKLAQWAQGVIGGSGISVSPYSLWGNNTASVSGGNSIQVTTISPQLQVPVAFYSSDSLDTRTIVFRKSYFYGKLTGTVTAHKVFTFTHNMNSKDLVVSIREGTTNKLIVPDITFPSLNTLVLTFGNAPANGAIFYVTAVGVEDMQPDARPVGYKSSFYVAATSSLT